MGGGSRLLFSKGGIWQGKKSIICKPNYSSFEDISLQLHAVSITDNPFDREITKNTTVEASVNEPVLPSDDTVLLSCGTSNTYTITIPSGVKVVKVRAVCLGTDNGSISLENNANSVQWGYVGKAPTVPSLEKTTYVGVTPNKTYTLKCITAPGASSSVGITVFYSLSINLQTPTITDY